MAKHTAGIWYLEYGSKCCSFRMRTGIIDLQYYNVHLYTHQQISLLELPKRRVTMQHIKDDLMVIPSRIYYI